MCKKAPTKNTATTEGVHRIFVIFTLIVFLALGKGMGVIEFVVVTKASR